MKKVASTINGKIVARIGMLFIAVLVLVGYGVYEARNWLQGPQITIQSPQNGAALATSMVTIAGQAKNIVAINLNDRPIFVNERGDFQEQLLVPTGYTIMKLEAKDKFGRETTKYLELSYASSTAR